MVKKLNNNLWRIAVLITVFLPASAPGINILFLEHDPIRYFSEKDWMLSNEAFEKAANNNPNGVTNRWHNPETGASGAVTPISTYNNERGQLCRCVMFEGHARHLSSRYQFDLCKGADGTWRVPAK